MKTLIGILLLLLIVSCNTVRKTAYTGYLVYGKNYVTQEHVLTETLDVDDVLDIYHNLTNRQIDTTRINPYYDESTMTYYFYAEKKKFKRFK